MYLNWERFPGGVGWDGDATGRPVLLTHRLRLCRSGVQSGGDVLPLVSWSAFRWVMLFPPPRSLHSAGPSQRRTHTDWTDGCFSAPTYSALRNYWDSKVNSFFFFLVTLKTIEFEVKRCTLGERKYWNMWLTGVSCCPDVFCEIIPNSKIFLKFIITKCFSNTFGGDCRCKCGCLHSVVRLPLLCIGWDGCSVHSSLQKNKTNNKKIKNNKCYLESCHLIEVIYLGNLFEHIYLFEVTVCLISKIVFYLVKQILKWE